MAGLIIHTVNYFQDETITSGGTFYDAHFNVFIDYNRNGLFNDPGERVFNAGTVQAAPTVTGVVSVPSTATLGVTRMRVLLVESGTGTADPCTNFTYGEVEDYTVNITSATGLVDDFSQPKSLAVYPNPAQNQVFVVLPQLPSAYIQVQLTDLSGKTVSVPVQFAPEQSEVRLEVDQLTSGMYFVRIVSGDQVFIGKFSKL
jgi:hypothetical protein